MAAAIDSVAVTESRMLHGVDGKPYTAYNIVVRWTDGNVVTFTKRYSELRQLHQAIGKAYPRFKRPDFPPKKLWGSLRHGTIDKRRQQLDAYLQAVCKDHVVASGAAVTAFFATDRGNASSPGGSGSHANTPRTPSTRATPRTADEADWLTRMVAMVQQLRAVPGVVIKEFTTFPGVSAADLASVEQRLGCRLHDSLRSFYSQTNGLRLYWYHNSDERVVPEAVEEALRDAADRGNDLLSRIPCPGAVWMPSLQQAFITESYEGLLWFPHQGDNAQTITFAGAAHPLLSWCQRLRVIDGFSLQRFAVLLLPATGSVAPADPLVFLADDYGTSFLDSRVSTFSTYLETLLATCALVPLRVQRYSQFKGDTMPMLAPPPRSSAPLAPQSLRELLRACDAAAAAADASARSSMTASAVSVTAALQPTNSLPEHMTASQAAAEASTPSLSSPRFSSGTGHVTDHAAAAATAGTTMVDLPPLGEQAYNLGLAALAQLNESAAPLDAPEIQRAFAPCLSAFDNAYRVYQSKGVLSLALGFEVRATHAYFRARLADALAAIGDTAAADAAYLRVRDLLYFLQQGAPPPDQVSPRVYQAAAVNYTSALLHLAMLRPSARDVLLREAESALMHLEATCSGHAAYNLACCEALRGDYVASAKWLKSWQLHGAPGLPADTDVAAVLAAEPCLRSVQETPWMKQLLAGSTTSPRAAVGTSAS